MTLRKNMLVMMVGLPRSGKSTRALELSREHNAPIVNPDSIHLAVHGTAYRAGANPLVWAIANTMVHALFLAGHDVVILDACNNTKRRRAEWKDMDWDRYYEVLSTDKEECLRRARDGDRSELTPVIERMDRQHEPVEDDERDNRPTECPICGGPRTP